MRDGLGDGVVGARRRGGGALGEERRERGERLLGRGAQLKEVLEALDLRLRQVQLRPSVAGIVRPQRSNKTRVKRT